MAVRPWVTPEELLAYTSDPSLKERSETQIQFDIARAEDYVEGYCNNRFDDNEKYPEIPDKVRRAVILIAEMYAAKAQAAAEGKGTMYKSESLDDYSYTLEDSQAAIDNMIIGPLLDPFIIQKVRHGIKMHAHAW